MQADDMENKVFGNLKAKLASISLAVVNRRAKLQRRKLIPIQIP